MPPRASFLISPPPPAIGRKTPFLRGLLSVCAAFGVAVVSSVPAFAGHYDVVYTYSGSASPGQPDGSGGFIFAWEIAGGPISTSDSFYGPSGVTASASTSGTVKAKFTWVRDPNVADDDPPANVWVSETGSASWSGHIDGAQWHSMTGQPCPRDYSFGGNASNGLGGTYVPTDPSVGFGGMSSGPAKISEVGGGETFTKSCDLSASATADGGRYWRGGVDVSVTYGASVIATPYHFRKTQFLGDGLDTNNYGHILVLEYTWRSTTGDKSQLSDVTIYEHVQYDGPDDLPYHAPSPFDGINVPESLVDFHLKPDQVGAFHVNGSEDLGRDQHKAGVNHAIAGSLIVPQEFRWYKPVIHDKMVYGVLNTTGYSVLDGPGPSHPITRTVTQASGNTFKYEITTQEETYFIFFTQGDLNL